MTIENNEEYSEIDLKEQVKALSMLNEVLEKRIQAMKCDLDNAYIQAEEIGRTKDKFLANMSHDLRTPLNAIIGFSEILYSQINDVRHRNYIEVINTAGNTLLDYLNNFIGLSKTEPNMNENKVESIIPQNKTKEINSFGSASEISEEVLELLINKVVPLVNNLKVGIKGNTAKELSELLMNIGNKYKIEFLILRGNLFSEAVECFDILRMNEYVKLLEEWITNINTERKGKYD